MVVYPPGEPAAALNLCVGEFDVKVPRIPIRKQSVRVGAARAQVRQSGGRDTELSRLDPEIGAARNSGVPQGAPVTGDSRERRRRHAQSK
jgi:hypothetical protein